MQDIKVTEEEVLKMLYGLKENKTACPDHIPPRILRMAAKPFAPCLAILFNKFLKTGIVLQDWHTANISPVFEKGERYKPANYRPVSLTYICSKMLEHIVVSNLMKHFDQHNILSAWLTIQAKL